jgi:mannosyltransferase
VVGFETQARADERRQNFHEMKLDNLVAVILKHKNQFWLLVAIAVAYALRVYLLGAQSLWNDEGTSVALAPLSLNAITNAAAHDIHPPLYYYLLHFWMPVVGNPSAGSGEFAIRFLSVIAGVLTVAFTFRIAYVFFDEEIALFAAYLSAFSAFQVYYSQEARMYIWVTLFASVSVYAMTQMLKRQVVSDQGSVVRNQQSESEVLLSTIHHPLPIANSRRNRSMFWLLYIVATIAMLYTQYVGAFVVVAENIAFVVWLVMAWRDKRPHVKHSVALWVAAQAIVGLATLPWYLSVREQIAAWPSISDALDLPTLLWRVLNVFSVGLTIDAGTALPVALAFGILFFVGWYRKRDANADWVTVSLILWTLVPVMAMYIVSLSRPAYNPKFLLLATPPFFILAARGLSKIYPGVFLQQRHGVTKRRQFRFLFFLIAVLAVVGSFPALRNYFDDPQYARDDYRAIVQFIDSNSRDGDGILVDAPGQIDAVKYYHRGNQPLFLLPRMRPPDPAQTIADVDDMLAKTRRLFAIYYATEQSDPQGIIETRLAQQAFKASDEWRGNVRLAIYGVAPNTRAAPQSLNVKFGNEITLIDYQLDARQASAGDVLNLTLNWRAEQTPSTRYKVFVHLLDANNQVIAQRDGEPVSDTRITTTWHAGETIADNYGIFIDPGTPPGDYKIEIGMYNTSNGERLRIGDSDHLIIGSVKVN